MSRRILCKFFAHGACLKGEHCEFAHDWKAPSNNICTYYQKGVCAYGSRCRYDHVKVHRPESSTSYLSTSAGHQTSDTSSCFTTPSEVVCNEMHISPASVASSPSKSAWTFPFENFDDANGDDYVGPVNSGLVDRAICSFAAVGHCPRGDKCPHIHGDRCPSCGKHCLHPFSADEREEHMISCERKQKHLNSLKYSQEIECSVCLERVLSKPSASERKFGLLSECDHPFCISCIRNWRSSSPTSGMDVNSALRACPICRKLSYFVIPSVIWYATKEEKQEIISGYKSRLKSIDCKYFDYGSGSCPFGSSCFYKHAYRDGRLEEVVLRHLGAADGDTVIAKDIRLSEFLSGFSGLRLR